LLQTGQFALQRLTTTAIIVENIIIATNARKNTMVKFGLGKLLKHSSSDKNKDESGDDISCDENKASVVDERPKTNDTVKSCDSIEVEERKELFGANVSNGEGDRESKLANDCEDVEEDEEDLHKTLAELEIPDFDLSTSLDDEDDVNIVETSSGEGSVDYKDRLEREEVYSKRYHPSKSEYKELEDLAERLGVSSTGIRLTTCQNTIHHLLFGKHSIILKKGPISFNDHDCEMFIGTDGFVAVYENVNIYNPLESRYDTCQLWSDVEFVEVANFGALKIQTRSGESFEIRFRSNGEDLKSWLESIEHVAIQYTLHNSSTITDVFGWQYELIRKPAYTAAVMSDMKVMGNPSNLNQLDDYNQSAPLHYAIQNKTCQTDIIDALLKSGADPNLPDGEGYSAMYYAQRNNLTEIEDLLRSYGGQKSEMVEIELKGELFGGVDAAKAKTEQRREIEQAVKDNKAAEAAAKAQSAQSQMSQNMSAMIERGEKINAIDNKAQQLNEEAKAYGRLASKLKEQAQNKKWYQF